MTASVKSLWSYVVTAATWLAFRCSAGISAIIIHCYDCHSAGIPAIPAVVVVAVIPAVVPVAVAARQ
jgi:hypothetical protein